MIPLSSDIAAASVSPSVITMNGALIISLTNGNSMWSQRKRIKIEPKIFSATSARPFHPGGYIPTLETNEIMINGAAVLPSFLGLDLNKNVRKNERNQALTKKKEITGLEMKREGSMHLVPVDPAPSFLEILKALHGCRWRIRAWTCHSNDDGTSDGLCEEISKESFS